MTSQSPRIYTYKITFEEVPYYYYGVHKEKKFDEYYMGSPYANKWCWEFYEPEKQILEFFEYSDEGWVKAQEIEKQLIKPFYNTDKWCLNESCGGFVSLNQCSKGGKTGGKKIKELKLGIHGQTKEQKSENSKKAIERHRELGTGVFGISPEQRKETNQKINENNRKNKVGIYSRTKKQLVEIGKKWGKVGSKKTNSQKWMCLETGYITTSGPLTVYQRAKGIDTSKRKRME